MKNAHQRFGVLQFTKRMKDTTTDIRLRPAGEVQGSAETLCSLAERHPHRVQARARNREESPFDDRRPHRAHLLVPTDDRDHVRLPGIAPFRCGLANEAVYPAV